MCITFCNYRDWENLSEIPEKNVISRHTETQTCELPITCTKGDLSSVSLNVPVGSSGWYLWQLSKYLLAVFILSFFICFFFSFQAMCRCYRKFKSKQGKFTEMTGKTIVDKLRKSFIQAFKESYDKWQIDALEFNQVYFYPFW